MKYAFAFLLIALFAVISITQAMPNPEEATAQDDGKTTLEIEVDSATLAKLQEAMGGRAFDWKKWLGIAVNIGGAILG
uniref:Uncharacterized protein n=1 Tax=Anopheles dirus TaxID=7168 RepID=A0A182NJY0_9DIPT